MANPPLGEDNSTSPPHWLLTATHIAVWELELELIQNKLEEGESPPYTRRSRLSLNGGFLFVLFFLLLAVLPSSMIKLCCVIVTLFRRIGDERERLVAASLVMTKKWGPSWGKQLPGERPSETAETWHTAPQPSRHVRSKGATPLSGAGEQTARAIGAYAQCACLLPLQKRRLNFKRACALHREAKSNGALKKHAKPAPRQARVQN
jgi:hypothetical protein